MLAWIQIEWWHYATFISGGAVGGGAGFGGFHRRARVVKFREALAWTCLWVSLSLFFAWTLVPTLGPDEAQKFLLGYILELSLSMDNVFRDCLDIRVFPGADHVPASGAVLGDHGSVCDAGHHDRLWRGVGAAGSNGFFTCSAFSCW
jgi:hypothetical protein